MDEIRGWLVAHAADLLQVEPCIVESGESFYRMGLDSAAALGLTGDLEPFLGRAMPASLLYDHPSRRARGGRGGKPLGRSPAHMSIKPAEHWSRCEFCRLRQGSMVSLIHLCASGPLILLPSAAGLATA